MKVTKPKKGLPLKKTKQTPETSSSSSSKLTKKTATELAFEKSRKERLLKKNDPVMSHKEKVAQLNARLAKLSEHHDIPKVGPG